MNYRVVGFIGAFIAMVGLNGCANMGENQQAGSLTGGIIGGLLGSGMGSRSGRTAAIIGGSVVGSMIGNNIGYEMDQANRIRVARALETTRLNHSRSWVDSHTGYKYTVKPTRTFHQGGSVCREYDTSIIIDGQLQQAKGRACRDANENWVIDN